MEKKYEYYIGRAYHVDEHPFSRELFVRLRASRALRNWSAEDLDDQDYFTRDPGWWLTVDDDCAAILRAAGILVGSAEEYAAWRAEVAARKEAARQAARAASADMEARMAAARAVRDGYLSLGESAAADYIVQLNDTLMSERAIGLPPRDKWVKVEEIVDGNNYVRRYNAGEAHVIEYGDWDDSRVALHVPAGRYDDYMRAEVQRQGITPAAAREWLAQYAGCVGHELREWAVAHPPEAQKS